MRASIRQHPKVKKELHDALVYYRDINPDLARRMRIEINGLMRFIGNYPAAASLIFEEYRHVVLPHFPYTIVYQINGSIVDILAFLPVKRDPAWMKKQLSSRN